MVTAKTFKPDFSKVNPYEDAPEEYFERIKGTQAYKTAVKRGWITDVPKVKPSKPPLVTERQPLQQFGGEFFRAVYPDGSTESFEILEQQDIARVLQAGGRFYKVSRPPVPEAPIAIGDGGWIPITQTIGKVLTIEDLARQYNIPVAQFVSQAELEDLALPPEQRKVKWLIPYEQYLTSAQAKVLGIQVPEGSVVKMSPLTEGEPTFTLLRGEEAPPELKPEIIQMLKDTYPERFAPGTSYGVTEAQLPAIVLDQIYSTLRTDYQGFVNDLYERIGEDETARFLKTLGVSEEYVLGALSYEKQNERIISTIQTIFPNYETSDFVSLVSTDFEGFIKDIQTESGASWTDKRTLLELIGFQPAEINEMLRYRRTVVPIDGIRQLITVDINTQAAYDANGDFMGKYNPATKEFTKAPDKNIFQNMWDTLTFSSRQYWENFEGFVIGVLPEIIYPELPEGYLGGLGDFMNETNRQQRENWRFAYAQNKAGYDTWVEKHPEIRPKTIYQEGAFQHPELLKDPDYWAYEVANIVPLMLAMMAVGVGTGGTGIPFLALSTAGMGAVEGGAIYEDLINAGAPRDKAANISLVAGGIIGLLESVGRIPLLKQISPALLGAFKKRAGSELAKRGLAETIKRFGRNFTTAQFAEVSTEMSQEVIGNVAVGFFDENRGAFENIGDIAVKTAVAIFPLAVLGGATSIRMVKPSEMKGLSDAAKRAKGWLTDNKGNWYEAVKEVVKEERGAIELPGKPEEIKPEVTPAPEVTRKMLGEIRVITKETDPELYKELMRTSGKYGGTYIPETGEIVVLDRLTDTGLHEIGHKLQLEGKIPQDIWDTFQKEFKELQYTEKFKQLYGEQDYREVWADVFAKVSRGKEVISFPETSRKLSSFELKPAIPKAEAIPEAVEPAIEITTPTGEKIPSTITEAPIPAEGATARVFSRIQTKPAEIGFKEKVKQGWYKFNIKMVDDLDPIRRIVEQIKQGDVQLSIDENPYLLARLLRGVTSKSTTFLEYGTFGKNFYKVDKQGRASPNYTGESLQSILNEVKDPVKWRDFSTYLTARRSVELSARDIETGIEVVDAKASITELEAKYPQFEGLAQRVYKYQDSLLVYANEMGLLSKELLTKLRKYGNYVPFYRVFNELQAKGLFGKKMANVANPIKRIKGSEREIINPLESIVKNTYVLISAADRNQVGIAIANLVDKNPELADIFERVKTPIARVAKVSAKELGVEIEGLTEAEEEQMVDIFRPSFFVRGDEVTVLIDGKKHYYRVDADLRDSLLRLDRESLGLLGKWLGAPARWLRAGATLSPDFMFRNPARDQMTAFAYSNYGFMPGIDWIKGLASMLRKDKMYQLFRMSGAEHSMLVSMDRSYLRKTFKQIVEGKGFTEYVKHPMELFRIISEAGEKATRLGEFRKGIQSGAIPLEAGYSARVVTLDFSQAGTTAQAINTFIAFFNANIRGWGRMVSSFKEHPIRTSAKVFAGITLPSLLLWAVNHDDDRWKEIPQWQKDLFWLIFIGDNIIRIPKPFELGIIFGSVPERFLDWLVEKDPELMKDVAKALMEAGSPGFIPTAGLPILEWITNYSFFRGRAIVPKSRQAMPPELQYTQWTTEFSKKLGEFLSLSPAQIDNFMYAWTGGLGRYAADILDGILKGTGISPDIPEPSPTLADLPVIKAFVVRSPYGSSSEAVNDFYKFLEKYEASEKYLKEMLITGELDKFNKYKAAHPELFFFADFDSERYQKAIEKGETPKDVFYSSSARYLRRIASQLSELWKKEDLIYKATDISPSDKRRLIDEIEILKTDIARKAVDLLQMKDPTILQDMINEETGRLGEIIEEATPLSLEKPDIHDMGKLNQSFKSILEGATIEELQKLEGVNPLAIAWVEKEKVENTIKPIINKRIMDIDFNLKEGVTFEDYYKQWGLGLVVDSPLEKISGRQVELLRKYQASDNKPAFLKTLTDEQRDLLKQNPQQDYLRTHPKENAQLAVWGQAKLLTKEAYTEFKRLIGELDIPDSAIPEMSLPPEGSVDNYFKYQDMENKNSWEAQLMLAKDNDLLKFLERQPIDTPIASLELKVKNRANFDKLDGLSDKDSPDYIADDKARAEAIKQFRLANPEFVDDMRRIEAIEKGTEEAPVDDALVTAHVDYGKLIDQEGVGSSSAETMLFRVDNPEYDTFRMDENIWGDKALEPIDQSRIPIWRIDVKWHEQDTAYEAIKSDNASEQARLRQEYLGGKPEYRMDRRRREAYQMGFGVVPLVDTTIPKRTQDKPTEPLENIIKKFRTSPEKDKYIYLEQAIREYGQLLTKNMLTTAELSQYNWDIRSFDWSYYGILPSLVQWGNEFWKLLEWVASPERSAADISRIRQRVPEFADIIEGILLPIYRTEDKAAFPEKTWNKVLELAVKRNGKANLITRVEQDYKGTPNQWERIKSEIQAVPFQQTPRIPLDLVEPYVAYYEYSDKGFRRERFLVENPDFAEAMHRIAGIDLPDPAKVPSVEYDNIIEEWEDDFNKWSGLADNTSEFYIEDPDARQAERDRMKFTTSDSVFSGVTFYGTKRMTGFGLAMVTRDAHYKLKGLQGDPNYQSYVNTYVQYSKLQSEGKPKKWEDKTGTDKWYEDDWFLMENLDFYRDVYVGVLGNQRKDFRKVPTRGVFNQYLQYLKEVEGTPRYDYRWNHRELDAWLVDAFGYTPITEKKRREELTPTERAKEEMAKQQAEWDKQLEEIEKILEGIK